MPSVTDLRISELAALGFNGPGSLRDRQMARLVSMGAVSGSYTDRVKTQAGMKLFPEQPYAPLGGGGGTVGNPTLVQSKPNNTSVAAQIAATFDAQPAVGNMVFIIAGCPTAGVAASVSPDQAGFTKISDRIPPATTGYWCLYARKYQAGDPLTYSWTSPVGTNSHIMIAEFSGMPAYAPDQILTADSAGVAVTSQNIGPTAAPGVSVNELEFYIVISNTVNTGLGTVGGWPNVAPVTNRLGAWYNVNHGQTVQSNGYSQTGTGRLNMGLICIAPGSS